MRKRVIYALIGFLLLVSCSPEFKASKHLRKAKAHILKAESFGANWQTDTIYKEVPVIVPRVKTDTIFKTVQGDTVEISKDRLVIRYVRLPGDSVYIQGECKADTVKIEVPVVVNKEIKCPPDKWKIPAFVFAGVIVLVVLGLLFMLTRRS